MIDGFDNHYSTLVRWLKVGLPLAALMILSTLFLLARTIDPAQSIPYAEVSATDLAREQRIGQPRYATVTRDGTAVSLSADMARPKIGTPSILNASDLRAQFDTSDGEWLTVDALDGVVDGQRQTMELGGGVVLNTSLGYRIETDRLAANLIDLQIETDQSIRAVGPLGELEAGKLLVSQNKETGHYLVAFKGGVRLIYRPAK